MGVDATLGLSKPLRGEVHLERIPVGCVRVFCLGDYFGFSPVLPYAGGAAGRYRYFHVRE